MQQGGTAGGCWRFREQKGKKPLHFYSLFPKCSFPAAYPNSQRARKKGKKNPGVPRKEFSDLWHTQRRGEGFSLSLCVGRPAILNWPPDWVGLAGRREEGGRKKETCLDEPSLLSLPLLLNATVWKEEEGAYIFSPLSRKEVWPFSWSNSMVIYSSRERKGREEIAS